MSALHKSWLADQANEHAKRLAPLVPMQKTGLRDHGGPEAFRARQIERMKLAGWPAPKDTTSA